jgi:hypothetical protein
VPEQHWLLVPQLAPLGLHVPACAGVGTVIVATIGKAVAAPRQIRLTASRLDIKDIPKMALADGPLSFGFSNKCERRNSINASQTTPSSRDSTVDILLRSLFNRRAISRGLV